MSTREYDLILWGASGFTGRLVAEYLCQQYGNNSGLKWAVGGRDAAKLQRILDELGHPQLPIVVADGFDKASLLALTAQTKVVCSTVGPYMKYGSLLVEACVEAGTHYCDLTGEAGWIRQMIDLHHETAAASKVKIVHSCGFDSVPSDMGVYFLQKEVLKKYGVYAPKINMRVKGAKGGVSGGTIASMLVQVDQAAADREFARLLVNPYTLNPDPNFKGPDARDFQSVAYDPIAEAWITPFVMARINTRIVRRSNALAGFLYGENFTYEEAMISGRGLKGRIAGTLVLLMLGVVVAAKPGGLIQKIFKHYMPKPGEGPSKKERENGYFNLDFYGIMPDGAVVKAKVKGDRDPGYGSTSKMLAECAVCLAKDEAVAPEQFGVLTPATALGDALLARLTNFAGLSFVIA